MDTTGFCWVELELSHYLYSVLLDFNGDYLAHSWIDRINETLS